MVAAPRLPQPQAEHHEHDRRDHEHEEGNAPAEGLGKEPAEDRAQERTHRVGQPVEAEHVGADLGGVVVRDQRVVRRPHHGAAHARTGSGDHQHEDRGRETGEEAEHGPRRGPDHRDPCSVDPVGVVGEGDLEEEPAECRERDQGEVALVVEAEVVADLGSEDSEDRAIELVDGVEAEEDDQRVERVPGGDVVEVPARTSRPAHRVPPDAEERPPVAVHGGFGHRPISRVSSISGRSTASATASAISGVACSASSRRSATRLGTRIL